MTMIDHVQRCVAPAAYALLPPNLASPAATALLLTVGMQETRFAARRQGTRADGPARGFWQFEVEAVAQILGHHTTAPLAEAALRTLCYARLVADPRECHVVLEDNDTIAFLFARLLVSTLPDALPRPGDAVGAWAQYTRAWRPGTPRRSTWDAFYVDAWARITPPYQFDDRRKDAS